MKLNLAIITGLVLVGFNALANDTAATEKRETVVKEREAKQQERINEGVKSGELTTTEAARLQKQEGRIDKMNEKAMADGKMSKKEFRRIERAQNHESDRISRKKHNGRHQ